MKEPLNKSGVTCAIVSTMRDVDDIIDTFIKYHLSIGFDMIILIFDDPAESCIKRISKYEKVLILHNDDSQQKRWAKTRLFKQFGQYVKTDLIARQVLNTEVAIQVAKHFKIDWILHIDCDELFYCPNQSVKEHFLELTKRGISEYNYINYEAVVEKSDYGNIFEEVTLFKKNSKNLSKCQRSILKRIKIRFPNKIGLGFIAYDNGKSAGKVSNRLMTVGPHVFSNLPPPFFLGSAFRFKFYKHFLSIVSFLKKRTMHGTPPIILHYPCCGFKAFWNKYKTLGFFPDVWLGKHNIIDHLPFHINARNVVLEDNESLARDFFEKQLHIANNGLIKLLLRYKIYCRITLPADRCKVLGDS